MRICRFRQRCVVQWSVVLLAFCLVVAPAWAAPTTQPTARSKQSAKAAVAPQPTKVKPIAFPGVVGPMGLFYVSHPEKSLQGVSKISTFLADREMKRVSAQFIRQVASKLFPNVKSVTLHRAIELLPRMLKPLGVDLSKPMGGLIMRRSGLSRSPMDLKLAPVLMLSVDRLRLMSTLTILGFSPRVQRRNGVDFLTFGKAGQGSTLGAFQGNRLYLAFRVKDPKFGLQNDADLQTVLGAVASHKSIWKSSFAKAGSTGHWKQLSSGALGVYFLLPDARQFNFLPMAGMATRFLKSAGIGFSFQKGARNTISLRGAPALAPLFGILAPGASPQQWQHQLPQSVGWMGQFHLRLDALHDLMQKLPKLGLVPPMLAFMATGRYRMTIGEMKAQGIDIVQLGKLLSGQFMTGMLWDETMQQRLKGLLRNQMFRAHMRGVYAMIGTKKDVDSVALLQFLHKLWKLASSKRAILNRMMKVEQKTIQKRKALVISPKGISPMYLVANGRTVLFAGDKHTLEQFMAVWQGTAPSLGAAMKRHANTASIFRSINGNYGSLHPRILLDLLQVTLPRGLVRMINRRSVPGSVQRVRNAIALVGRRMEWLRFETVVKGATFTTSSGFRLSKTAVRPLAPKQPTQKLNLPTKGKQMLPVAMGLSLAGFSIGSIYTGVIAAVAIPAFLRFTRRSKGVEAKLNLKALADGATAYYDSERTSTSGDPLPRTFPGSKSPTGVTAKREVFVAPSLPPCYKGRTRYPRNSKVWSKEPWRSLKFGITKRHYYQYTYIRWGVGKKSQFIVRAKGDLDCDGKYSTFEIRGKVNPITGEIERSQVISRNPTE